MDLKPGSEAHRLTRAATALVSNLYPLGYSDPGEHVEALAHARCIETARALNDTLVKFGLPSKLLPVDILAMNPEAYKQTLRGMPVSTWPDEAWSVGIIDDTSIDAMNVSRTGGWNGHMLVRVAKEWLCDPNAGQFHRPGKINMPASWTIQYPRDQWNADREGWALSGIVSSITLTPEHPEFPILKIRQRPDNTRWTEGTAATIDLTSIVGACVDILTRLRSGDLGEEVLVDETVIDLRSVIDRYQGAARE